MSKLDPGAQSIVVPAAERPPTLKEVLRRELGQPHRRLERLIRSGRVHIDGEPCVDPGRRTDPGTRVTIAPATEAGLSQGREGRPRTRLRGPGFVTIFEDRDLIAVSKAPGIVVIPTQQAGSAGTKDGIDLPLVARVAAALRTTGRRADPLWVIHRIDRDTSGLVVFARNEAAYARLRAAFRQRRPRRVYLGWVSGVPEPPVGQLQDRLAEDPRTHRVEVVSSRQAGKVAVLEYATEATGLLPDGQPIARVRVTLTTGRRNQIRAQLAQRGWPLLGDRWYGPAEEHPLDRAALHAWRLAFDHPSRRGKRVELEAPVPADLRAVETSLEGPPPGAKPKPR